MTGPTRDATHPGTHPEQRGNPRGNAPGTQDSAAQLASSRAAEPTSAVKPAATHPVGAAGVPAAPQGQPEGGPVTTPKRVQRQRTKGWRMPEGAVYVGRGTVWGNPWVVGSNVSIQNGDARQDIYSLDPEWAVKLYRLWVTSVSVSDSPCVPEKLQYRDLEGLDLVCWCPLTYPDGRRHPCHADVLLELANPGADS